MDYLPQKCMQLRLRVCVWVRIHTDDDTHATTTHTREHTIANDECVFVCQTLSHCQSALWGFPRSCSCSCFFLAFCCCCLWFCCFLFMFFVFSLLSVPRISCGRRVICICIAIATAIAFAFMHVDPLRLTPSPLPLPFPFTTPITLHWVKRSLCAVQPRICTFYGHVYGLQLIDYAWAEWTMPEMCKCSNAAHPLPALPSLPPLSLSPGWNCMTTAQEAAPPPHQLARLRSLFSNSAYPPGELVADCYSYPTPPLSLVQAPSPAIGYVMNSICSQLASWLWFTVGFCSRFCQRNKVLNTEIISGVTNSLHNSQLICLLWHRNKVWESKVERMRERAVCATRGCSTGKDRNDNDRKSSEICILFN